MERWEKAVDKLLSRRLRELQLRGLDQQPSVATIGGLEYTLIGVDKATGADRTVTEVIKL